MRLAVTNLAVRWREPLAAAHDAPPNAGAAAAPRPLVLVELTAEDGVVGYGEAAPLTGYDGVGIPRVLDALARYVCVLGRPRALAESDALEACRGADPLPQALASIDLALWNITGRRAGQPVHELLKPTASSVPDDGADVAVDVNAVIGADTPDSAAEQATAAVEAGYRTIKIKVGVGDDVGRVGAVRASVGGDIRLRIDANGAWSTPTDALAALDVLAAHDLELCEEPVHGASALAAVARASPVPICVDESMRESVVLEQRIADAVCLKISASGGITGMLDDAHRARELGYEVCVASTLDGPLGVAAALHAAAVIAPDRACGLSTLDRFDRPAPFAPQDGRLSPPAGAGLGNALVDWYMTRPG